MGESYENRLECYRNWGVVFKIEYIPLRKCLIKQINPKSRCKYKT